MNTKNPIYYVKIDGDIRDTMYTIPNIIGVKYDTVENKTEVLVKASKEDETEKVIKYFYRLHEDLLKQKKQFKKEQVFVNYLPKGIDLSIYN